MRVVADSTSDGGLIIHPAVAMTPVEAAHYRSPDAIRLLDKAMASVSGGRLQKFELRSDTRRAWHEEGALKSRHRLPSATAHLSPRAPSEAILRCPCRGDQVGDDLEDPEIDST